MNYQLLILTPAINRPNIHTICFKPIIDTINISTKWIIHIDYINHINNTIDSTKKNIFELNTNKNIDIEIITSSTPCFFNAITKLLSKSTDYLTTIKTVFFLEDDWLLIPNKKNLMDYIHYSFSMVPLLCTASLQDIPRDAQL